MTETQTELGLATPAPKVTQEQVKRVVAVLAQAGRWMTRREICAALGEGESAERWVRLVAAACAPRIVSFPGSKGYALWQHCTVDEILHTIEAFDSQGRDMIRRGNIYRQALHRGMRGVRVDDETLVLQMPTG